MEKFVVEVCKGTVTNQKRDTSRIGYWIPVRTLPRHVAGRFGADKATARTTLGFDLHQRQWRDMKHAVRESSTFCNATVVTMDDGTVSIALLDF